MYMLVLCFFHTLEDLSTVSKKNSFKVRSVESELDIFIVTNGIINKLIVVMFKFFIKLLFESEEYLKKMPSEILPVYFTEPTQREGPIHICKWIFLQILLV